LAAIHCTAHAVLAKSAYEKNRTGPMQPYLYMQQIAGVIDTLDDAQRIHEILDEIEFLYEVIDPEHQHLADDLIARLNARLKDMTAQ
jgi:hypothetical protein